MKNLRADKLFEKAFTKNGIPKCQDCGKPMVMAVDSITKRKSKHLWKWNCNCVPKNLRLSIG